MWPGNSFIKGVQDEVVIPNGTEDASHKIWISGEYAFTINSTKRSACYIRIDMWCLNILEAYICIDSNLIPATIMKIDK